MRVAIVFPPSICLPNQIYYSLPMLAGALRRAGHEPFAVDLNLLAADLLLDARMADDLDAIVRAMASRMRAAGHPEAATATERNLDGHRELFLMGEECKRVLRDPARFYDQPRFKAAFWTVVDVLAGYYQLEARISPFRTSFAAELETNQRTDAWTVVGELYERGLLEAVERHRPQLVGISVAFPEQAVEAVRFARRIRARNPGVVIVFGGPLITGFQERWFEHDWLMRYCDYAVLGDGETAIVELCDALDGKRPLESVRNLVRSAPHGGYHYPGSRYLEAMDDLPVPDFAAADLSLSLLPEPIYPLMLSRGCYWGKCTFCSIGWRENYRMASPGKIAADAREVARRYGGRFVQLQDSSVPPRAATALADVVEAEGLGLSWIAPFKFERVLTRPEYVQQLARGGCKSMLMGFESSDQRLLDLMGKGYAHADLELMLTNLRTAGISAELLWFIGFPSQTRADVLATATYLWERRAMFGLTAFVGEYQLHPDTEVFQRPAEFGVTVHGLEQDHCVYTVANGISSEEAATLRRMLAGNNNRTLTCNGSHLPHLAVTGIDLRGLERPPTLPPEVVAYCREA